MTNTTKELTYMILHPVSILAITPFATVWASGGSMKAIILPVLVLMLVGMLPTWAIYKRLMEHPKQTVLTSIGGIFPFLVAYLLIRSHAPELFVKGIIACVIGMIACVIFDNYKSISLHVAMVAGCTTVAMLSSATAGMIVGAISIGSNWSVLATHRATVNETLRTWATVSLCTLCVFSLL